MRQIKEILRMYHGIIVSLGILSLSLGGLFVGVIPGARATLGSFSQVRLLETQVAVLTEKASLLGSLDETSLRQQLAVLVSALPVEKSVPSIFSTMDRLSGETGLLVVDMTMLSPGSLATEAATAATAVEKQLGSSLTPFSLSVQGTFVQMGNFLAQIGRARRLIRLRNFDISISPTGTIQGRLGLDAFYSPLPSQLGAIEAKVTPLTGEEEALLIRLSSYPWLSEPATVTVGPATGGKSNPFAK